MIQRQLLGDSMKTKLTEEGTKIPEDENKKLWRYLNIWKFIDLLSTSKLHFTRVDKIKEDEPFDSKYPDKIYEILKKNLIEINKFNDKQASMDAKVWRRFDTVIDKLFFINCWNISDHESAAMWKIYTQENKGIAIQTTYKKLMHSIEKKGIMAGLVEYIDHNTLKFDDGNLLSYGSNGAYNHCFLKHISYNYEKEFRLGYASHDKKYIKGINYETKTSKGTYASDIREFIKIPIIDLNNLIENIYASPFMDSWQIEILNILLHKFRINKKIQYSELYYKELKD